MDLQALKEENYRLSEENRQLREIVTGVQALVLDTSVPLRTTLPKSQSTLPSTNQETKLNQKRSSLSVSPAKSPILGLSRPPFKRRLFTHNIEPVPQPSPESNKNELDFEPGANKWEVYFRQSSKSPSYAYKEDTVRGKARKALPGHPCTNCENYYKAAGIDAKGIRKCSKHRSRRPRQKSPKGYSDLDFPSTQELQAKWAASPSPDPK
ncbi:DNA endonuclease RBBP8 [Frankliniella fusca]|uniref:DNA endonuclease RBBP8 n=1 Tax=Frankliniella fusca TaxID=407009 RepID=A0AAE1LU89_9NEOP|nr:DNA endonuclease RBBP8 [Frankliniella fusca]